MSGRDDRCEDCDLPRADRVLSDADREAVLGGGMGDLCWGRCEEIDWRGRALAAEATADRLRALEAVDAHPDLAAAKTAADTAARQWYRLPEDAHNNAPEHAGRTHHGSPDECGCRNWRTK